jgi:hypothetical protein
MPLFPGGCRSTVAASRIIAREGRGRETAGVAHAIYLSEERVTEAMRSSDHGTQKRRSTRVVQAVPVTVTGVDALGQPFKERTTTVSVNCHGCRYQSKHYVPKNSTITLEISRRDAGLPPRALGGRVIWVERPRTVRELFQVGLEFETSGNVWDIAFPSEDWFPCRAKEGPGFSVPQHAAAVTEAEPSTRQESSAPATAEPGAGPPDAASARPTVPVAPSSEAKIFVVPDIAQPPDAELGRIREMAKMVAESKENLDETLRRGAQAAIHEEIAIFRQQLADQLRNDIRGQIQQASERAIEDSLDRLRRETAKYPAEFEQSCREILSRVEEEFAAKSSEAQHTTYEALMKASEWYQKKAHTTMQSSLEKAVEQSAGALRDRAAEISSLAASELDHHRRTYTEYGQAQMEETATEILARERAKLNEAVEMAGAGFADRAQQTSRESLRQFEQASRQALEKARSDMEYDRENSLAEFQKKIEERVLLGVENARTQLQSQVVDLVQAWMALRETQQREWLELLKISTDESMEQFKARLENASNSWLVASATTLSQRSQAALDTLANAARKRLRETCSDVLTRMGDALKEGLPGDPQDLSADETPPHEKK